MSNHLYSTWCYCWTCWSIKNFNWEKVKHIDIRFYGLINFFQGLIHGVKIISFTPILEITCTYIFLETNRVNKRLNWIYPEISLTHELYATDGLQDIMMILVLSCNFLLLINFRSNCSLMELPTCYFTLLSIQILAFCKNLEDS